MLQSRILLADDHAMFREALRQLLESRGDLDVVAEAGSGPEAVALAKQHQPDLSIVDLGMPELTGEEVIRQILRVSPACQVLVLSMHEEWSRVRGALQAGASGYLVKSAAASELLTAIDSLRARRAYISTRVAGSMLQAIHGGDPAGKGGLSLLTERELQVLQLVAEGRTSKEVAAALGMSVKTAESHRGSVMRKLEVHKASELVRLAIREGLITP